MATEKELVNLNQNKMKTAVEYLINAWAVQGTLCAEDMVKSKELEKQQIMIAVYESMGTNLDPNMGRAEQYYNETYKNTKE